MSSPIRLTVLSIALIAVASFGEDQKALNMADVLAASKPDEWRRPDPESTLYLELTAGRVVIELAPAYAPNHVANVKTLVREKYFDGLTIVRCQDNYVVQWADPNAEDPKLARKLTNAKATLAPEFDRNIDPKAPFIRLPDRDIYALETGFSRGFPVGRDPKTGKTWLVHCYGMVGAGRDVPIDSGGGTELYVVIGHAPRHLDRNVTLLGRVIQGIELLSSLPRGPAPMGFYDKPEMRTPIKAIRMASDVPPVDRTDLELLKTDSPSFEKLIESRRNRREDWYHLQAGHIEICDVPQPVRAVAKPASR